MKPKQIYGWDGFELTSGDLQVGLTPSIGGRIMSLIYQGQELLFVDNNLNNKTLDVHRWSDLVAAKKAMGFCFWGGDKTWVAPQEKWLLGIPPLDLDAGSYQITWDGNEAVMTSAVCRETGLQIIRRVSLKQGKVNLVEELYNRTSKPIQWGLWNVTQVKRPCYFEILSHSGGFRSYHHEDSTLPVFKGDLSLKQGKLMVECVDNHLFKVGGLPSLGELSIYLPFEGKKICWKKSFSYEPQVSYAHHSAVEVFNSPSHAYAEIELHAPFKILVPGESSHLEQIWEIRRIS